MRGGRGGGGILWIFSPKHDGVTGIGSDIKTTQKGRSEGVTKRRKEHYLYYLPTCFQIMKINSWTLNIKRSQEK